MDGKKKRKNKLFKIEKDFVTVLDILNWLITIMCVLDDFEIKILKLTENSKLIKLVQ